MPVSTAVSSADVGGPVSGGCLPWMWTPSILARSAAGVRRRERGGAVLSEQRADLLEALDQSVVADRESGASARHTE